MKLSRREFVAASSCAVIGGVLRQVPAFAQQAAATPPVAREFIALRRNVGTWTGRGGVMGWLIAPDGVVIVDTQFPDAAEIFLTELKPKSARRIDLVMNSHHHPDHTSGNKVMKTAAVKIVAHEQSAAAQRKQSSDEHTEDRQAYPDETFTDSWKMDVGSEVMAAKHYGPAHTAGDSAIHFERANVVHMGDLVSHMRHPRVDLPKGGSVKNWVTVIERTMKDHGADTIYIYGHSKPGAPMSGPRADLVLMRDYLTGVLDYVHTAVAAGKSEAETIKATSLPKFPKHEGDLHYILQGAYQEMTRKA